MRGDDDQIVLTGGSAFLSAKIVKDSTLKVYPGAPHGLAMLPAWKDEFHTDLRDQQARKEASWSLTGSRLGAARRTHPRLPFVAIVTSFLSEASDISS